MGLFDGLQGVFPGTSGNFGFGQQQAGPGFGQQNAGFGDPLAALGMKYVGQQPGLPGNESLASLGDQMGTTPTAVMPQVTPAQQPNTPNPTTPLPTMPPPMMAQQPTTAFNPAAGAQPNMMANKPQMGASRFW